MLRRYDGGLGTEGHRGGIMVGVGSEVAFVCGA